MLNIFLQSRDRVPNPLVLGVLGTQSFSFKEGPSPPPKFHDESRAMLPSSLCATGRAPDSIYHTSFRFGGAPIRGLQDDGVLVQVPDLGSN